MRNSHTCPLPNWRVGFCTAPRDLYGIIQGRGWASWHRLGKLHSGILWEIVNALASHADTVSRACWTSIDRGDCKSFANHWWVLLYWKALVNSSWPAVKQPQDRCSFRDTMYTRRRYDEVGRTVWTPRAPPWTNISSTMILSFTKIIHENVHRQDGESSQVLQVVSRYHDCLLKLHFNDDWFRSIVIHWKEGVRYVRPWMSVVSHDRV